tara:strand:- start:56 stop:1090 length:1035 start_codon:yes stop_codon:yes gene_type:complete
MQQSVLKTDYAPRLQEFQELYEVTEKFCDILYGTFAKEIPEMEMLVDTFCPRYLPHMLAVRLYTEASITVEVIQKNPWKIVSCINHQCKAQEPSLFCFADGIGLVCLQMLSTNDNRVEAWCKVAHKEVTMNEFRGDFQRHVWLPRKEYANAIDVILKRSLTHCESTIKTQALDPNAYSLKVPNNFANKLFDKDGYKHILRADASEEKLFFTTRYYFELEMKLARCLVLRRDHYSTRDYSILICFEKGDKEQLKLIVNKEQLKLIVNKDADVEKAFEMYNALDDIQRGSIRKLVLNRILVLVGGAGTGKTSTLIFIMLFIGLCHGSAAVRAMAYMVSARTSNITC